MQSEPAIESRAAARGSRRSRKRDDASAEGPVFVDNSGRRSKLLRRIGLLMGVGCLVYAVVLGAAFMGWGTSLTPSSLLPFGNGGPRGSQNNGPGGFQPQGGVGTPPSRPTGTPPTGVATGEPPSSAPTATASATAAAN
ncbi:hypothetical protein OHS71_17735 [Streptomyces sp. NBC_00377]|uniref:hypothetical protein n=1 Tax=unclassified Streptomyces TaxID=2593676 RepID=UPI002E1CD3E4|nr:MULTISPECIES: hypothetical protein [unclassified Streptomyces]